MSDPNKPFKLRIEIYTHDGKLYKAFEKECYTSTSSMLKDQIACYVFKHCLNGMRAEIFWNGVRERAVSFS